jgi:pSer/pThr/pTyr-binding forkhead associated (FHA) protein
MPSTATNASGFFVTIATQKGSTTKRVDGDLLSVGRSEECNLSIAHETMSRRHLSVTVRNGECYVEDHGSANGTLVARVLGLTAPLIPPRIQLGNKK